MNTFNKPMYGIFQNGHHDNEKYELIYVNNDDMELLKTEKDFLNKCEEIYLEFNSDKLRPSDYYGYSLSVDDVIVFNNAGEFNSYMVKPIGFEKLDAFLTKEMRDKLMNGIDVRLEYETFRNIPEEYQIQPKGFARIKELSDFDRVFEMADKRAWIFEKQKLDPLFGYLKSFDHRDFRKDTTYFAIGKAHEFQKQYSLYGLDYNMPVKSVYAEGFDTVEDAKKCLIGIANSHLKAEGNKIKLVSKTDLDSISEHIQQLTTEERSLLDERIEQLLNENQSERSEKDEGRTYEHEH